MLLETSFCFRINWGNVILLMTGIFPEICCVLWIFSLTLNKILFLLSDERIEISKLSQVETGGTGTWKLRCLVLESVLLHNIMSKIFNLANYFRYFWKKIIWIISQMILVTRVSVSCGKLRNIKWWILAT